MTRRLVGAQRERGAAEAGHSSAGFLDQEHAGQYVPGLEAFLPEAVDATRGQVAQVEGGRAVAPDRAGVAHEAVEEPQAGFDVADL